MPLPRTRPLDELAGAASGGTLVVGQLALARALADRVRDGRVTTPEEIVGRGDDALVAERRMRIRRAVDAPFSTIDRIVAERIAAWRHRGSPHAGASGGIATQVADLLLELDGPERRLAEREALAGDVVVLAPETLDPLQRRILPDGVGVLPRFAPVPMNRQTIHTATNRMAVTDAVVAGIDEFGPDRVGVVADPEGPYWGPLRGTLSARGIAHDSTLAVGRPTDDGFLELLGLVVRPGTPSVDDARGVLSVLGLDPPSRLGNRSLDRLEDERAVWVGAIAGNPGALTIDEILDQYAFRCDEPLDRLAEQVRAVGVAEHTPNRHALGELRWQLSTQMGGDRPPDGVHIATHRAAIVDRQTVFFLGVSKTWMDVSRRRFGPMALVAERRRLAGLLASGDRRVLLAGEADLERLEPEGLLGAFEAESIARRSRQAREPIAVEPTGEAYRRLEPLTKTKLNALATSPKDAVYSLLLGRPRGAALTRGAILHDYAELALANPEAIASIGRARLLEAIYETVVDHVPAHRTAVLQGRLQAAIAVIDAYLDDVDPDDDGIDGFTSPEWRANSLAERFGLLIESGAAEQYFLDRSLGVSGVVDLIRSPTHLVDFKTGVPRSRATLVARARDLDGAEYPDTQLPLYLATLRGAQPDLPLRMSYLYCQGWLAASLAGRPDPEVLARAVEYVPAPADQALASATTVRHLREAIPKDHPRAIVVRAIGIEAIVEALRTSPVDGPASANLQAKLASFAQKAGVEEPVATAGARSIVHGVADRRAHRLFADDLDAFEAYVARWRDRLRSYDRVGYPLGDPPEHRLDNDDMLVELAPLETEATVRS